MANTGSLTALQLNAGAGLLQNQGLGINGNLTIAIAAYENTSLISPFLSTITTGSANILSSTVLNNLKTLAANACSALSNSIPPPYSSLGNQMTTVIRAQAAVDICGGDVSKLTQAVNQAQGYSDQTSVFINSALNSQSYLGNTFTNINGMITGGISSVNLATGPFGTDLQNLGRLINLKNLGNFGSPLALIQQLYSLTAVIPTLTTAFIAEGIDEQIVLNLTNPTVTIIDSVQKRMYTAMTKITGKDLTQVLSIFKVTTVGITTMADLLNPLKLFPNSYQSLTAPTANGPVAIYVNKDGSINNTLLTGLPSYVVSSLV